MKFNILILDDEQVVCNSMKRILQNEEWLVLTANTYNESSDILDRKNIDLLLLDYKLDDTNGIDVLKDIREKYPSLAVIMITAYGSIDIAVEAMKLGAYDFIQKKVEPDFIRYTVKRALDNLRLKKEVDELKAAYRENIKMPEIVSESPQMKSVLSLANEYARSDSTVLITGETGTGKSLLAEYIHRTSDRFNKPFIPLNCPAIPAELIESELFGYESGAFTGARQRGKKGLIEQADGGTLFLDEISELSLGIQSKLLQVLEKNAFFPVGAVEPRKVNVRFIAATNADLNRKVEEKEFRMDLFYRLNVAILNIHPLRDRKEDIIPLSKYFINEFNKKFNKSVNRLDGEVELMLTSLYWQGNIRELRNLIERAMLLKKDNTLRLGDFTVPFNKFQKTHKSKDSYDLNFRLNFKDNGNILHEAQKLVIMQTLELTNNNISNAAKLLGLPRTSLNSCMKRFGIEAETNK